MFSFLIVAMQKKPDGEVKFPNGIWAGLGFSKSMPDKAIREKLRSSNVRYQGPAMTTTYEEEGDGEGGKAWGAAASPSSSFNGGTPPATGYTSPRKSGNHGTPRWAVIGMWAYIDKNLLFFCALRWEFLESCCSNSHIGSGIVGIICILKPFVLSCLIWGAFSPLYICG